MKNNKVTQAVMLVFVLGVWGTIFYKIYDKLTEDDDAPVVAEAPGKQIGPQLQSDTFQLLANYNDPFLYKSSVGSGSSHNTNTAPANPVIKKEVKASAVPPAPLQVKYMGMIRNNASKKKVALISINGKTSLMQESEEVDHVKLIQVLKDSVLIVYNKQRMYVRLN